MGDESFWRGDAQAREARTLPASTYNLARGLLTRSPTGCLFVPIRTMQYLAIIDREEIVFVDGQGSREIEIAWQEFRPRDRASLADPVKYQAVYYLTGASALMSRLQAEFPRAMEVMASRQLPRDMARVIRIENRKRSA